jgi:protein phosphatase 1 regulatory subunit 7
MRETRIGGLRFSEWADGRRLLIIESDRLKKCIQYCNKKRIQALHISRYHGYKLDNIDFLADCPEIQDIHLQSGIPDLNGLYSLHKLTRLSVVFEHKINFALLPRLVNLATDWSAEVDNGLFSARRLKRLWLRGYRPKQIRNLARIENLVNLEYLHIIFANITSTDGIESLPKLKQLGLSYCRNLKDISALRKRAETLNELEIDRCGKLQSLEATLEKLNQLRKIILCRCGTLRGLNFVKRLPRLEFLSFVEVDILDGDLTPCLDLKYVGFQNKRHFSHTFEEVRSAIQKRSRGRDLYPR